jgi:Domain of unknown function (DUF1844)
VSTLWTPSGEHRVPKPDDEAGGPAGAGQGGSRDRGPSRGAAPGPSGQYDGPGQDDEGSWEATPEEARQAQEELDAMREQLAHAPAELVIANHAMGLWELAALHLSQQPPHLPQAQLAIDALSSLVDGLQGRLGEDEKSLREGLAQIRMAFVQIANAERTRQTDPEQPAR